MAASRIGSSAYICRKYKYFFYAAIAIVCFQLFIFIHFYGINASEPDLSAYRIVKESVNDNMGERAIDGVRVGGQMEIKKSTQVKSEMEGAANGADETVEQKKRRLKALFSDVMDKIKDLKALNQTTGSNASKCDMAGKEVKSAIMRATSNHCKEQIAETYCMLKEHSLYPAELPRYCPLKGNNKGEYMGCYRDHRSKRILDGSKTDFKGTNTPEKCINHCLRLGFNHAGVQYGFECFCGELTNSSQRISESICESVCPGDESKKCGGYHAMNIYHTGFGAKPDNPSKFISVEEVPSNVPTMKIVFVLTMNGRALRQVRRLFKALYHTDHYYYIHVDKRQEYLHRELSGLVKGFPNVAIAPTRFATIWGGASLLKMHLQCMEDLLKMTDWKWDYFINLSESDYPIKFIRKQGLNMLFLECDTHMWRLGERSLQDGIRIDGGSDWFCLHRDFATYVTQSKDELVTGLKAYWEYSLLPAESFFHTVLQNSKYCSTWVNNNLHLTNWRRKQGCKCQYKHVVDWCGCSPNDFMPKDFSKIRAQDEKPIYFARKFEAIINQEIINDLDAFVFGHYPADTLSLRSYWQNDFHHLDVQTQTPDHLLTAYSAMMRMSAARLSVQSPSDCHLSAKQVLEVTIFNEVDIFTGLLIKFKAVAKATEVVVETLVQMKQSYKLMRPVGAVKRLMFMEVGSSFDPKEELFRNFGNLLGPNCDIKLKFAWGPGAEGSLTIVYVDPSEVIAGSFEYTLDESESETIQLHSPDFFKPLRPGIWKVQLLYLWETVAETEFLILPLTTLEGVEIQSHQLTIHDGPADNKYSDKAQATLKDSAGPLDDPSPVKMQQAAVNARKTGPALAQWVDELVGSFWKVSESCMVSQDSQLCQHLRPCEQTKWSSMFPDPKSEIGSVDPSTGRLR